MESIASVSREFCSTDLKSCLQRYAQNVENPHYKDMVEATFEGFEALLNYRGKLSSLTKSFLYLLTIIVSFTYTHAHVAVARKVLEENLYPVAMLFLGAINVILHPLLIYFSSPGHASCRFYVILYFQCK